MRRQQASLGASDAFLNLKQKYKEVKKTKTSRDKANRAKQKTLYGSAANI